MENEFETLDSSNEQIDQGFQLEEGENSDIFSEEPVVDQEKEELKKKNRQLFERLKRAQGFELVGDQWVKKQPSAQKSTENQNNGNLSLKDIRALSDVPDADVDEVLDFAKFKNISVAEAKNNPVMQTLLRTRAEERASAQAVTTAGNKRGVSKVSDDVYLSKVQNGEDMSEDEMRQAALAQIRKWKQN